MAQNKKQIEYSQSNCYMHNCRCTPIYSVTQLWGNQLKMVSCEKHKPDVSNRPESLKKLPFFYKVEKL